MLKKIVAMVLGSILAGEGLFTLGVPENILSPIVALMISSVMFVLGIVISIISSVLIFFDEEAGEAGI